MDNPRSARLTLECSDTPISSRMPSRGVSIMAPLALIKFQPQNPVIIRTARPRMPGRWPGESVEGDQVGGCQIESA